MSKFAEKIIAVSVVLFLLAYVGYQAWRYIKPPVRTSTVYEYKVSQAVRVQGIAMREEQLLEHRSTGSEFYLHEDGSRVAVNETVAEVRRGGRREGNPARIQELEEEIRLLEEAGRTAVDFGSTQVLGRDIKQELSRVSAMALRGRYEEIDAIRRQLTADISKKQVAGGKVEGFEGRIRELRSELQSLKKTVVADGGTALTTPHAGYFSSRVDGWEARLTAERRRDMKAEDYLAVINGERTPAVPARIGRVVASEKWTFAAVLPEEEVEWIRVLDAKAEQANSYVPVTLVFESIGERVSATLLQLLEAKDGSAVALFSCNRMSEPLINMRHAEAEVLFEEYSGLRINTADLRFRTNAQGETERGVYVLRNNKVYFRQVDPVYEEEAFVLSEMYYTAEEYLEPQRQAMRQKQLEESAAADVEDPPDLTLAEQEEADRQQLEEGEAPPQEEFKRYVLLFDQVINGGSELHDGKMLDD